MYGSQFVFWVRRGGEAEGAAERSLKGLWASRRSAPPSVDGSNAFRKDDEWMIAIK